MVYNDQSDKWEKVPPPEKSHEPEKGKVAEKEEITEKTVHLKRRSETETDEPQAKKGSLASTKEQTNRIASTVGHFPYTVLNDICRDSTHISGTAQDSHSPSRSISKCPPS